MSGNGRQGPKLSSSYCPHEPVDVYFDEPSRTRQEFANECDINHLMARFEATGVVSHMAPREPFYLDVSELPDLQEALRIVNDASTAFMSLPAVVRKEFDNDPVAWAEYAVNPDNVERMREWGLAKPAPVPAAPMKVEVISTEPVSPAPVAPSGKA